MSKFFKHIFSQDFPMNISLTLIVTVAFLLRLKGIWFGYPLALHPDEPFIVNSALKIISTGDLNPHFFNYPSLNIYLQSLLYVMCNAFASKFGIDLSVNAGIFYFIASRCFNVLLSVLTIVSTYFVGFRLFSKWTGLTAALFLTFSFLHISNSYLATVDTTVALWVMLVVLMSIKLYMSQGQVKYYVLGSIFVGCAIGSKYTAFLSIMPMIVSHLWLSRHSKKSIINLKILCLLLAPITFLITTPYALLDFKNFWAAIAYESAHYSQGHIGSESESSTSYLFYVKYLYSQGYGVIPTALSILGAVWLSFERPWKALLLLVFPILYFYFMGKYKVHFDRNMVAMLPFLALLGGYFVTKLFEKLSDIRSSNAVISDPALFSLFVVAMLAIIWPQYLTSAQHINRITLPDTRWLSLKWVNSNLPAGAKVGREHYTPPVEYLQKFEVFPFGYHAVIKNKRDILKMDYMIVSSGDYLRFFQGNYPREAKAYNSFFNKHILVKEFVADGKFSGGPKISIYKVSVVF